MTNLASDLAAYAMRPPDAGEAVCFWRPVGVPDLDCLSAHFITHRYPMHRHDAYVIAVIRGGRRGADRVRRALARPARPDRAAQPRRAA